MPHVSIKIITGRSEEQKQKLADQIVKDLMVIAGCDEHSVSVSIEEIDQKNWTEEVYKRDIAPKWNTLYKKPGYNPL